MPKYNELTPEEARIILHKGTEYPGTGELLANKLAGTYICRQCNAQLYKSDHKFHSGCGWPAFDDEIPGAVKRQPDADGFRVEIDDIPVAAFQSVSGLDVKIQMAEYREGTDRGGVRKLPSFPRYESNIVLTRGQTSVNGLFWTWYQDQQS